MIRARLAHLAPLPWTTDPHDAGVVYDATGRQIVTVDVWGERPDRDVDFLAAFVRDAVNERAERLAAATAQNRAADPVGG